MLRPDQTESAKNAKKTTKDIGLMENLARFSILALPMLAK
jgi:hypothetical protein